MNSTLLHSFAIAVACLASSACVTMKVLRVSSANTVPTEKSTAHYAKSPSDVFAALQAEFGTRGLTLAQQVDGNSGAKIYLFKGKRAAVTTVRGTSAMVVTQSNVIGVWVAARVQAANGGTDLSLLAKPSVNGQEVCSDADKTLEDAQYWCQNTEVREDFPFMHLLSGREEAEVVQGTLASLSEMLK